MNKTPYAKEVAAALLDGDETAKQFIQRRPEASGSEHKLGELGFKFKDDYYFLPVKSPDQGLNTFLIRFNKLTDGATVVLLHGQKGKEIGAHSLVVHWKNRHNFWKALATLIRDLSDSAAWQVAWSVFVESVHRY